MTADGWAKKAVMDELSVARDASETRSFEDLRGAIGIGHEDLEAAVTALGDEGKLSEIAPAEYVLLDTNAAAREDAAAAREDVDEPGISLAEAERRLDRVGPVRAAMTVTPSSENRTILTKGVAQALDAQTLGQLVKAGIDESIAEGRAFVFEVVP